MKNETYDELMQLSFGSFNPCIAFFPHCIFKASAVALTIISKTVNTKIGIWGNAYFLFNLQGEAYLQDDDAFMMEDFHLWETLENQKEVLRYCEGRSGAGYVMGIDCHTELDILQEMHQQVPEVRDAERFEYFHCLNFLCEWIKKLQWAYVLLDNDYGHAMFVTSHKKAELVATIVRELEKNDIEVFYLQDDGKRFHWETFQAKDIG